MPYTDHHALVFGATGLAGLSLPQSWPPTLQPLHSPASAISNQPGRRPRHLQARWGTTRPPHRVVVLRDNSLTDQLRSRIDGIGRVTHVFYFELGALNTLTPRLKSIVYPGGTRGYGINVPNGTLTAPFEESMADNIPADYAKTVASPWFRQFLTEASTGRGLVRGVSRRRRGFSPIGSNFSLALHWAHCLSLYARNHGVGEFSPAMIEVPFPGTEQAYNALFMPIAIHAAVNPGMRRRKTINMATASSQTTLGNLRATIKERKHIFGEKGRPKALSAGVGASHKQLDSGGWWLTFDQQLSTDRLRAVGFTEEQSPVRWLEAFDKFRAVGIIF
ncbi:hypothetical protein BKA56DRAFT_635092 [Ilyonectria sp. MPI-CAGE-AT-0026]|nr:hypothetical protein BKA56DRAFT_635092 [Ilyonectria sp. MPI-CAGE-AT-0026]